MTKPRTRATWDQVWLATAQVAASRSRCDRAQVGAVIVTTDNRVAAVAYNGPPRGQQLTGTCSVWCHRYRSGDTGASYDECPTVHAEANALLLNEISIRGGTIYVSRACCVGCAKLIANSGLARVVHVVGPDDQHRNPNAVEAKLRECGLEVVRASRVEEL